MPTGHDEVRVGVVCPEPRLGYAPLGRNLAGVPLLCVSAVVVWEFNGDPHFERSMRATRLIVGLVLNDVLSWWRAETTVSLMTVAYGSREGIPAGRRGR